MTKALFQFLFVPDFSPSAVPPDACNQKGQNIAAWIYVNLAKKEIWDVQLTQT